LIIFAEDMEAQKNIAIIGSGSWATAIVKILSEKNCQLHWYIRKPDVIEHIKKYHHNPSYISSAQLQSDKINFYTDVKQAVAAANWVIVATPSAFLKDALNGLSANEFKNKVVISAIKGMIPGDDENRIIAEYFNAFFNVAFKNFVVISGPCHAEEVALEKLSYLTLSCPDTNLAATVADLFACRYIKTNFTEDIYGTELAAVMKNIIALASGICHGLGYGDNFQAVLVANAIQEIEAFVKAVHPIERDIKGSAYLGDLLVTAYSQFSRNRAFGLMIGKGYSVKAAQLEMNMIAEGYYAVKCIHEANLKYKVDLPITTAVYNILYERMSPIMEIKLMTEKLK
jgi:glycerol-3-phosphate dehydrogenase (NAD(P)+)